MTKFKNELLNSCAKFVQSPMELGIKIKHDERNHMDATQQLYLVTCERPIPLSNHSNVRFCKNLKDTCHLLVTIAG